MAITYGNHFQADQIMRDTRKKVSSARVFIYSFTVLLALGLTWAWVAPLDVVARGMGKVVPSTRPQILQNLEGGVLRALLVRTGDRVTMGQEVARLDSTRFSAELGEVRASKAALTAAQARLLALIAFAEAGADDDALITVGADLTPQDRQIVTARAKDLSANLAVVRAQIDQRQQELAELAARRDGLERQQALLRERIGLVAPAVQNGFVPRARLLDLRQQVLDIDTQLVSIEALEPRARAAIREMQDRLSATLEAFRTNVLRELSDVERDLSVKAESMRGADDRLRRTVLTSPVDGIVNRIPITTIGGTVRPGDAVMEITPIDESVLVEVRISPSDVGFLHEGQAATVKLTAYDPSIYGSLSGTIETIGADSIRDERGVNYFNVQVRVEQSALLYNGRELPIVPGMEATVDILTGERTVMQYFLKPLLKATDESFRER